MSFIEGQQVTKTNFSAVGQTLVINTTALNVVRFEFSGTYSFTTVFESSTNSTDGVDGNWFPFQVSATNSNTNVTSHATVNATQAYLANCSAVQWVRVRVSAFTSAGAHRVAIAGDVNSTEPIPSVVLGASTAVIGQVTTPTGTPIAVTSTASTNASIQKSTAGNLFEISVSNPTATPAYVKLYNKATAPTVGTDIPVLTITAPAASATQQPSANTLTFSQIGKRFPLGIAMAITGAAPAADTSVAVAGVQVHGTYV